MRSIVLPPHRDAKTGVWQTGQGIDEGGIAVELGSSPVARSALPQMVDPCGARAPPAPRELIGKEP
jgi:hypothetical protein